MSYIFSPEGEFIEEINDSGKEYAYDKYGLGSFVLCWTNDWILAKKIPSEHNYRKYAWEHVQTAPAPLTAYLTIIGIKPWQ